jgi:hypothetical protein
VEMEQCLQNLKHQPVSFAEMDQALVMMWNDIPQDLLNNLLGLMREHCILYLLKKIIRSYKYIQIVTLYLKHACMQLRYVCIKSSTINTSSLLNLSHFL